MTAMPTVGTGPELVFGLVGPTGSDLGSVADALRDALGKVSYSCDPEIVRVAHLLHEFRQWAGLPGSPEDQRLDAHMNAGNELRQRTGFDSAMALLAIGAIRANRIELTGSPTAPAPNHAFVLRSFKHPDEIRALQRVYRGRFFLLGAYASRHHRVESLAAKIARSHLEAHPDAYRDAAERLVQRDQNEEGVRHGQHLGDAFPLADVFVDASNARMMRLNVERFVELLFGRPFITPNEHEYGMFLAQAAALRSAQMGRQVGAVIVSSDGDVVAVGANEVPKAGGGSYWADDEPDGRDHVLGYDSADRMKRQMLAEVLTRLSAEGWLKDRDADISRLLQIALGPRPGGFLRGTQIMSVLEYGRAVHAEMAAITDAARRGVPVRGCSLYVTTFPCHNCARHIVAAGIGRVFYIEPYPKSLASTLHLDAIATDHAPACSGQVEFVPFVGVAPRRYMELFTMPARKTDEGEAVDWESECAQPRVPADDQSYIEREGSELEAFRAILERTMPGEVGRRGED